jgi:two-component system, NtrC family, sensor kinase
MKFNFIRSPRISLQLLLMFLAIEFPAEIALVYVSYYNSENILTQELNNKLQAVSERQSRQINDYFDNQINSVSTLAQIPDFIKISETSLANLQNSENNSEAIKRNFSKYQEAFKLANLLLVTPNKQVALSTDESFKVGETINKANLAKEEIEKLIDRSSVMLQTEFSDFTFAQGRNYPTAFIASPLQDNLGRFIGVLVAEINNEAIAEVVNDYTGLGKTGESLIISQVNDKTVATTAARFRTLSQDELKISASNPLPVSDALQGRFGSGFYTDYRDKRVFAYWSYIPALRSALIVKIDTNEAFAPIQSLRWILLIIVLATLGVVVLAAFSAANLFTNPIRQLTLSAQKFAEGKLDERIELPHRNEIGKLKDAFNQMAESIQASQKDLADYNSKLEQKVEARTKELQTANQEITAKSEEVLLQKNNAELANVRLSNTLEELQSTQSHLVESEKMAMLGQLVAGVAHEINTPLGAIRSSVSNIITNLENVISKLPDFFSNLNEAEKNNFFQLLEFTGSKDLNISAREERKFRRDIQAQLEEKGLENAIRVAENLVEMGVYENIEQYQTLLDSKLCADIFRNAHTLSGILRSANTINLASDKASKIVFALKNYSRHNYGGEKEKSSIGEGLDTVLTIYHNAMKHGVELHKEYEFTEQIYCYPDELNQVWTNLIHNALQAMEYKGKIEIALKSKNNMAIVSIKDSGKGIPMEIQEKVFKPFFTTKPAGEGSGLGLDIVKKIIDKHQGKIYFASEVGVGTTFFVELPMNT